LCGVLKQANNVTKNEQSPILISLAQLTESLDLESIVMDSAMKGQILWLYSLARPSLQLHGGNGPESACGLVRGFKIIQYSCNRPKGASHTKIHI
jgi:hypothetical protein